MATADPDDFDLDAARDRLNRYLALAGELDHGQLPDLNSTASAIALGLAASLVAGDAADLFALLDEAHNSLAKLKEMGRGAPMPGPWLRWCRAEGCLRFYAAPVGPVTDNGLVRTGWVRTSGIDDVWCPHHSPQQST